MNQTLIKGALVGTWLLQRSGARTHAARAQVGIADLMVGGLLAGLAISRFAFPWMA